MKKEQSPATSHDTPRTEEQLHQHNVDNFYYVPADFARQLERELVQAKGFLRYHTDQVTRLACAIGAAGEKSEDVVTAALARIVPSETAPLHPGSMLTAIGAVREQESDRQRRLIELAEKNYDHGAMAIIDFLHDPEAEAILAAPSSIEPLRAAFEKIVPLIEAAHKSAVNKAVYIPLQDALQAVREALAAPSAIAAHTWIPVSDRLPEPGDNVLFVTQGNPGYVWIGWQDENGEKPWRDHFDDGLVCTAEEVTHWMPLPSSPTDGRTTNG